MNVERPTSNVERRTASLSRTNIVLGMLLAVVVLMAAAVNVDHSQPNFEFLPEMKRSPASTAYTTSTVFANGRTLQPPVAGTIARGELPLHYAATKEDAVRAGEELQNPYQTTTSASTTEGDVEGQSVSEPNTNKEPDAAKKAAQAKADAHRVRLQASVQRGGQIYNVSCVSCHGPTGAGDGPVAKRGFPPPPPLTTGKSAQMKDGQLFHILTYGQGSMAPMAAQLSRDRRWDVINYVRSLQQEAVVNTQQAAETPASPAGETDEASDPPTDQSSDAPSETEEGKP